MIHVRRSGRARGYTLMELVVASMISLMVIAGMYVVFAGHSRVFRNQEMVAQAQMSARFAMEVIRSDLRRAGFQAVSDTDDPEVRQHLCLDPTASLGRIRAIELRHNVGQVSNSTVNLAPAGPTERPDELTLVGNYFNAETYWAKQINGSTIQIQNNGATDSTDPMNLIADSSDYGELFSFAKNAIRLRSQNKIHFSRMNMWSFSPGPTGSRAIGLVTAPNNCGMGEGTQINVVSKIRYSVISPASDEDGMTANELALRSTLPEYGQRKVLVRDVLSWYGGTNPEAREVVAENVVDFQVWFLFDANESPETGPSANQVQFSLPDNATGGPPCGAGALGASPECAVRHVHGAIIRLSVRTPREDPNFLMPTTAARHPLLWYEVDPNSAGAARVRTLVSQVDLPNIAFGQQGLR